MGQIGLPELLIVLAIVVAVIVPWWNIFKRSGKGLGLKKWVVSCAFWSLNNVASGVNNVQATRPREAAGWHT